MELEFHSRNLITYYYISYRTIKYIIMNTINIFIMIFFLRDFQPIAFAPNDNSFIIRPRHQSIFCVYLL